MDPEVKKLIEAVESQLTIAGVDLHKWKSLRQEIQKRLVKSNFPKVGDKIYAKYFQHQYFPARVDSLDVAHQTFNITWDDNDTEGRVVAVTDVALDKVPGRAEIGVGSNVLFEQGSYGASGDRSGGMRWHMGRITNMTQRPDGSYVYDGEHVFSEKHGKWVTYRGYEREFRDLTLDQFRVSPNALDSFGVDGEDSSSGIESHECDVFVCYSDANTRQNSSKDLNPLRIISDMEDILGVKTNVKIRNPSLAEVAVMIQKCKVFVAFISNEFAKDERCQQQFQFAKKSKGVPVIPVVVGQGFDWTRTVVGLLIAGELYIHFKEESVYDQKMQELKNSMKRSLEPEKEEDNAANATEKVKCKAFISYCWLNSNMSKNANEIPFVKGNELCDPRRIKYDVEKRLAGEGEKLWLDIEQLGTSNQSDRNASMFEQIAMGLANTRVILTFISTEYSKSENCNMEFNHAVKTMKIPTIPIIVGEKDSDDWVRRQVGMMLGQIEARDENSERIDLRTIKDKSEYNEKIEEIYQRVCKFLEMEPEESSAPEAEAAKEPTSDRVPKIGDHVISHWNGGQFFFSTIVSYDRETMCFTVDWDDGDTTGRVVKYNETAKDVVVDESDVAIGTKVLFPQGQYKLNTEDEGYSGFRYFEGEITEMQDQGGRTLYSGHHSRYDKGQVPRFRGVKYEFEDIPIEKLRLAPNAFEVLNI